MQYLGMPNTWYLMLSDRHVITSYFIADSDRYLIGLRTGFCLNILGLFPRMYGEKYYFTWGGIEPMQGEIEMNIRKLGKFVLQGK